MFPPFGLFTRSPVMARLGAGNHCESFVMFLIVTIRDFKSGLGRNSDGWLLLPLAPCYLCCVKCRNVKPGSGVILVISRIHLDDASSLIRQWQQKPITAPTLATYISDSGSWILNATLMAFLWCLLDDNSYHYSQPFKNDTCNACQNVHNFFLSQQKYFYFKIINTNSPNHLMISALPWDYLASLLSLLSWVTFYLWEAACLRVRQQLRGRKGVLCVGKSAAPVLTRLLISPSGARHN